MKIREQEVQNLECSKKYNRNLDRKIDKTKK